MKKLLLAGVLSGAFMLAGCAGGPYASGSVFNQTKGPVNATSSGVACAKQGKSSTMNILGIVGLGDGSIDAAKKAAGITTVTSVDYDYFNVLGVYQKTTTIVCGK